MPARLTQLKTQRGTQTYEAVARKSGLTVQRVINLEGLGPITAANPHPTMDHADPFEEKQLESALGVGAGGLR